MGEGRKRKISFECEEGERHEDARSVVSRISDTNDQEVRNEPLPPISPSVPGEVSHSKGDDKPANEEGDQRSDDDVRDDVLLDDAEDDSGVGGGIGVGHGGRKDGEGGEGVVK